MKRYIRSLCIFAILLVLSNVTLADTIKINVEKYNIVKQNEPQTIEPLRPKNEDAFNGFSIRIKCNDKNLLLVNLDFENLIVVDFSPFTVSIKEGFSKYIIEEIDTQEKEVELGDNFLRRLEYEVSWDAKDRYVTLNLDSDVDSFLFFKMF